MTLRIERAPLAEALPVLLQDVSYGAEYAAAAEGHRLTRLRVGEAVGVAPAPPSAASERRRRMFDRMMEESREDRSVTLQRIADRLGGLRGRPLWLGGTGATEGAEERVAELEDSDPEARARAISLLRNDSGHLSQVISVLNGDPDPRVRVAAADWLGDNASYGAVNALLGAVGDPSVEVKLQVFEALEDAGDESVIVYLQPLLESPDPEVREAAERAIDFLE